MNSKIFAVAIALLLSVFAVRAQAAGNFGETAPDFPPGLFNDGQRYQLSDFDGKVVVLFFYEQDCPTCRGKIPERNEVVKQFQGKPVKFFAVAAGDTLQQAKSYAGGTKLAMPVFADSLSLMEKRYGQTISLQNLYQFRVIGPDGKVSGYRMEAGDIEKALEKVKPKYDPEAYHAKLRPIVEQLEWNQYPAGMKALKGMLKNKDKEVAESAAKLMDAARDQGKAWLSEAEEKKKSEDPVAAYDLYTKTVNAFGTDDPGKKATEAMKDLKKNDAVKKELDARKMYDRLLNVMSIATAKQKGEIAQYAGSIAKKFPQTPTGKKAEELSKEIGG
jgi:peroxiredoxin